MSQGTKQTKQEAVRNADDTADDESIRTMPVTPSPKSEPMQAAGKPAAQGVAPVANTKATLKDAERNALLVKRQSVVLRLVTEFIDQPSTALSLTALVNELQQRLRCDRVVLALYRDQQLRVKAISQQASVDQRSSEVRLLVSAMHEACEQDCAVHFPSQKKSLNIVEAHRALVAARDRAELYSLPLCHEGEGECVGALVFERTSQSPWTALTLDLMGQMAKISAPLIVMRGRTERGVLQLVGASVRKFLEHIFKPKHLALKCGLVLIAAVLLGTYLVPGTHRITADSELVPLERRVITAPIRGYIQSVEVAAGDRVTHGQTLLQLDVKDLELEQTKWRNEIRSLETESRAAMASHDRSEMAIARAKAKQAQAQLALVEQQISRAILVAPGDGIIVSGELSQAIGAPVERGETLLEIAPVEGYQVQLLVDETDVSYIRPGQIEQLSLRARPESGLEFKVVAVQPISQAEDGKNRFRVDADLLGDSTGLRPGQTGVAKVSVGEARTLWIWTHRFVEWFRLRVWEWLV